MTDGFKVGYPQALLYYKYFPLWETFFNRLGVEVVLSGPTNKALLNLGTVEAENELCLPVKVFYGHLLALADKVDAIFIPRMVSVEKSAYTCPKFMGLPDMARATETRLPPIMDPTINWKLGWRQYVKTIIELGSQFTDNKAKILGAYHAGVQSLHQYQDKIRAGATPIDIIESKEAPRAGVADLRIGLAGHPYNIYDKYISMNLIKRLREMGTDVVTAEMIPHSELEKESQTLPKHLFWTFEREVVGTVFHWSRRNSVDGIIYVLAFPCGPDSLIQSLLEHEMRRERSTVPMMSLVIDEHSAEGGFLTRIEAFVDMLSRKKKLAGRVAN
ncbi:MAG: acyl-CoA dehydratase activase-related protein [Actinomycetota bacterium]|nr:acyl-CoA dehydratase activase-related protein [Actinomycetota bacterium]